jgi:hypothetical protein
MKSIRFTPVSLVLFFTVIFSFSGCSRDCTEFRTYIKYIPLEKTITEIRSSFKVDVPKTLDNPKKIYIYGKYLFIVDEFKGFQIVDNSDVNNPMPLHFIHLDGCTDVSVNNGIIYANQGPDIVSLSIDNLANIQLTGRVQNVMNTALMIGNNFIYDYEKVEVTEEVACSSSSLRSGRNDIFSSEKSDFSISNTGSSGGNSAGTGGSMARMSFVEGILYLVDNTSLTTIDVTNGFKTLYTGNIGFEIETIFGTASHLFIGTSTGMLIYSRNNGYQPTYLSGISHARGCDPVAVQGSYAYVTVRGNGNCGEANNELLVVDIRNISAPTLHSAHAMNSPYGLGLNNDVLFICDGTSGLRIFDKSSLETITQNELATVTGIDAYDVIPLETTFILSTSQGVFQYDYTDVTKPRLLSKLY